MQPTSFQPINSQNLDLEQDLASRLQSTHFQGQTTEVGLPKGGLPDLEGQHESLPYFLEEVDEHLHVLETGFLSLRETGRLKETLLALFRAAHTLKGGSSTVGLDGFASLVHILEDAIQALQDEGLALDTKLENLLLEAVDAFRALVAVVRLLGREDGETLAAARIPFERLAAHLIGYTGAELTPDGGGSDPVAMVFDQDCGRLLSECEVRLSGPGGSSTDLQETLLQVEGLAQLFELGAVERLCSLGRQALDLHPKDPQAIQIVLGDLHSARALVCLGQSQAVTPTARLRALAGEPVASPPPALEQVAPALEPVAPPLAQLGPRLDLLRVEANQLQRIDSLVGELVIGRNGLDLYHERLDLATRQLRRNALKMRRFNGLLQDLYNRMLVERPDRKTAPSGFDSLELDRFDEASTLFQDVQEMLSRLDEQATDVVYLTERARENGDLLRQNVDQLREDLTAIRMQTFDTLSDRFPRALRSLSQTYGKPARLALRGTDTLLDRGVLSQLGDLLMHLIRNAFAHGIEPPAVRLAAGKHPEGLIEVSAYHRGNVVVVSVRDDGGGIDPARLAAARGTDLGVLDEAGMLDLLCTPGFSTAEEVGELAGRGVGLDAVRTQVEQLKGKLTLQTEIGRGTTFTLHLPLNLSIADLIVCQVGRTLVAFTADSIASVLSLDDPLEAVTPLGKLIYLPTDDTAVPNGAALAMVDSTLTIGIERVVSQAEMVIKPFPAPFAEVPGYLGCTVLGDGKVVPVIESSLLGRPQAAQPIAPAVAPAAILPAILVVEDSVALRHTLVTSLQRMGYTVATARDGQEALDWLRSGTSCPLVVSDVEMPRLNGFELLAQMKADPALAAIPLVYLTSRSGKKHRQMAAQLGASGYLSKPYLENDLKQIILRAMAG